MQGKTVKLFESSITGRLWTVPWKLHLLWEPRDLWVGVFFKNPQTVYVMLLPTLGLCLERAQRVRCSQGDCQRDAVIKCVLGGKYPTGVDYARDPLCEVHGSLGKCPSDKESMHVLIPKEQQWY